MTTKLELEEIIASANDLYDANYDEAEAALSECHQTKKIKVSAGQWRAIVKKIAEAPTYQG